MLFLVGALVCVVAPGFGVMVLGRAVLGLAVGGASVVVPIYLSEISPPRSAARSPAATS